MSTKVGSLREGNISCNDNYDINQVEHPCPDMRRTGDLTFLTASFICCDQKASDSSGLATLALNVRQDIVFLSSVCT
jgi:hypothetical protein